MMGLASREVWKHTGLGGLPLGLYAAQLALNFAWRWPTSRVPHLHSRLLFMHHVFGLWCGKHYCLLEAAATGTCVAAQHRTFS